MLHSNIKSSKLLNCLRQQSSFIISKDKIFLSLSNGRLLKVSIEDGKTKEIIKIDSGKISRPYILNKNMYILRDNSIIKVE